MKALEDIQASGYMFQEFLNEKNGIIPEVECLRVEFIDGAVSELYKKPLANQMLLEYIDNEAASTAPEHDQIS